MTMKKKWFKVGRSTGWKKSDPASVRRAKILKSRRGNYLKAAKALQALSNVTEDKRTKILAKRDANYFFRKHKLRR